MVAFKYVQCIYGCAEVRALSFNCTRRTSVCGGDGKWTPDPATLICEGKMCHTIG